MAAVFGISKAWFSTRNRKPFRIGLLGLLLTITALKLGVTRILEKLKWEYLEKSRREVDIFVQMSKGCCQHSNRWSYPPPPPPASPFPPPAPPQLGAVEIITHWICRLPLQELTFRRAHSSLKQSEIGMSLPDSIITCVEDAEDGVAKFTSLTNFPYHRSWWMNVIKRITGKNSDSDSEQCCTLH